ncbi:MAG: hypothetical protein A2857_01845 [Candidatus Levybacteria bacterium RIFCSPHIGHO2_01_FULL_36_15]|nr:MAG: hypothetical protein A2857_01845 [Candidatus Levybacteria bacterium RIFCSPHIGHO2_01_FULL_36_15]
MISTDLLGVNITTEKKDKILEYITRSLKNRDRRYFIVTPNPEILVYAEHHPEFKRVLNEANIALPDGYGIVWGAKLLGKPLKQRIAGVDLVEKLCERLSIPVQSGSNTVEAKPERIANIGFLGGGDSVAGKTADCLKKKYPGLKVAFANCEWKEELLSSKHIDILFVAFGFPKQEEWIYRNLNRLPVTVAMGVGGAFDYIGGFVPRAPKFVQNLGLEWLFRLIVQPWRWRRQVALVEYGWLIFRETLRFRLKRLIAL